MKKLWILSLLCILVSCQEQNKKATTETAQKFASIKIERFRVANGNKDSVQLASYIMKDFDSTGLETKSVYYTSDGSIMMQFENEYTQGNKTKVRWINKENKLVKYVHMSYDENNRIVKSESFNPAGEFTTGFIHQWKEDGKIEEKGPITESGTFKSNSIYTYNDQQEFTSLVEYDENDSLYGTFRWKYIDFNEAKEWTKRYQFFNDTLTRIEKRKIVYQD
jgi:hypothetical protein